MADTTGFRVADLSQNAATPFDIRPDAAQTEALRETLGVNALRKLRFAGEIRASGKRDWELVATLGATVVQDCVVTLDPVTTRIDVPVKRQYLAAYTENEAEEVEMESDDDAIEALGTKIDPHEVMIESLSLHVPAYPRKDDAKLGDAIYSEPGVAPMTDEDTKPFAGLAALKDQLNKKE